MHVYSHAVAFGSTDCSCHDDQSVLGDEVSNAPLIILAIAGVGLDVEFQGKAKRKEGDEKEKGRKGEVRS